MNRIAILLVLALLSACTQSSAPDKQVDKGNVVFIHPDGTGVGHWNLLRLVTVGPDGMTNWDKMERLGIYRPHQKNALVTTSHAGATVHAYGKKVHYDSYGMDHESPLTALSGKQMSIMQEAMAEGIRVGVINSGHIGEPGSGVYLASSVGRADRTGIAEKVLTSGADLIFTGGEIYTLPTGVVGHHGKEGKRKDGRNLLTEAVDAGYTVIYSKEELLNLPANTKKVIGIFAAKDTYNAASEEKLKIAGLPTYNPDQPSFDQMVKVALKVLSDDPERRFFLVAEEEGTDNFSNNANTQGTIDALSRADAAIGITMDFIESRQKHDTLLVVGGDSDAGHPAVWWKRKGMTTDPLPLTSETGAQMDGINGTGTAALTTAPDAQGKTFRFGVAWPLTEDSYGSAVTKAHGFGSEALNVVVDNTDIYKVSYQVLFGKKLD